MTIINTQAPPVPCKHGVRGFFCVKCYEEPQDIVVNRCMLTTNPCGTDTRPADCPCACMNCQAWLSRAHRRMQIALARLAEPSWETRADAADGEAGTFSEIVREMSAIAARALEGGDE